MKKLVLTMLAMAPLLLATGCNDETRAALWWLPNPWTPFVAPVTGTATGTGTATANGSVM